MSGDDGLSDGDQLAVWLAVHAPELREPYALAHRLLTLPEVAALRAKAAAADRVRDVLAFYDRHEYSSLEVADVRRALDGGGASGSGDGHRT